MKTETTTKSAIVLALVALAVIFCAMPARAGERNVVVCTDNITGAVVLVAGRSEPVKVVGWVENQPQFSKRTKYHLDRPIFPAPKNSTCFKGKRSGDEVAIATTE